MGRGIRPLSGSAESVAGGRHPAVRISVPAVRIAVPAGSAWIEAGVAATTPRLLLVKAVDAKNLFAFDPITHWEDADDDVFPWKGLTSLDRLGDVLAGVLG